MNAPLLFADPADDATATDTAQLLRRCLHAADGQFRLYLAVFRSPAVRDAAIAACRDSGGGLSPLRLEFPADAPAPLEGILAALAAAGDAPASGRPLLITGWESHPRISPPADGTAPHTLTLLHQLNGERERWACQLPRTVVLWLPEALLGPLRRAAPDFADWCADTFWFTAPSPQDFRPLVDMRAGQFLDTLGSPTLTATEARSRLAELRSRLADTAHDTSPPVLRSRARWLNEILELELRAGNLPSALEAGETSLLIYREIGDKAGEGQVLNNLSQIFNTRGDYDPARELLEASLLINREIGDKAGEGATLANLGNLHHARSNYDRARELFEASLLILREIGDKAGEGATLANLGNLHHARGDYDRARELLETSLLIRREIGDKAGEGASLTSLGNVHHARGDYDRARELLETSLLIRREIGDKEGEGATLNNLSTLHHAWGDYNRARELLEASLLIFREIGDKAGEGATLANLSQIYHARGDYDRARELLEAALLIHREIGDKAGMCPTLFNLGNIHLQTGDRGRAIGAWVGAYRIAKEIGHHQALEALAGLAERLGQPQGLEMWEELSRQTEGEGQSSASVGQ